MIEDRELALNRSLCQSAFGNRDKEESLLAAFYAHKILPYISSISYPAINLKEEEICNNIFKILKKYSCSDIIHIIRKYLQPFSLRNEDIPQFSSLEDCFEKVPRKILNCCKDGLTYSQMGYLLRTEPRNEVADMKYGENHTKTAWQLGLCDMYKCIAYPNTFGSIYVRMKEEDRKELQPKLCLYIPFISTLYFLGPTDENIDKLTNGLAETTKKRRISNIRKLKSVIETALLHEF